MTFPQDSRCGAPEPKSWGPEFGSPLHPSERTGRLYLIGLVVLGFVILSVWNPQTHPGPSCCWLRHAVALPCPFCGITRGTALVLRGQFLAACQLNPLVLPAMLFFLALVGKWSFEYLTGVRVLFRLPSRWRWLFWLAASLVILSNWTYVLTCCRQDDFAQSWLGWLFRWLRR